MCARMFAENLKTEWQELQIWKGGTSGGMK